MSKLLRLVIRKLAFNGNALMPKPLVCLSEITQMHLCFTYHNDYLAYALAQYKPLANCFITHCFITHCFITPYPQLASTVLFCPRYHCNCIPLRQTTHLIV